MSARIAVVEHQENCGAGRVGTWLVESGADLVMVRPYRGDPLPEHGTYDALLVLGGDMGANDDDTVHWLAPLKHHIRGAVDAGTPVLGICLGHQLVAAALGGTVGRNPAGPALGVEPVTWTAAAAEDPLFAGVAGADHVVHWNSDVVLSAPAGSTVLATARDGSVLAARFGTATWGIQAHPEVDAVVCRQWAEVDRDTHLAQGIDQEPLLAAIEDAGPELEEQWRPFGERFAALSDPARRTRTVR